MIQKHSTALWTGSLKDGGGTLTTQSGVLTEAPFTFATRFEGQKGLNPEELVGAAHAGCYAMFLSALMSGAGITPDRIEATSTISLDPTTEGGPTVKAAHLDVTVKAPTDEAAIRDFAEKAKAGCPISKLLKADVSLSLKIA